MIKIKKSKDGQFYFVVVARNGKVLTTSETYRSKRNCKNGVAALASVFRSGKLIQTIEAWHR